MTAPSPGWYPDPEAAGRQWRWWDGVRWAPAGYGYPAVFDSAAQARALNQQAQSTRNTGRWLRWAMAANAFASVVVLASSAAGLHDLRDQFRNEGMFSAHAGQFGALRLVAFPFQFVSLAFFVLLIAWIYNAGKFAELQGWPAARGRTLGAFSVIIPIVNFWWPYEAVRDCYPPGTRPPLVLHWWLAHVLIVPVAGLAVFFTALAGAAVLSAILVVVAALLAPIPVVLGWRLVGDLDTMQGVSVSG